MIVHLTFCAPQIVVCAFACINAYLAVHLLQRKDISGQKLNFRSIPLTNKPEPTLGTQTAFFIEKETTDGSLVYPEHNKQTTFHQLHLKAMIMMNEPSQSFTVFVDQGNIAVSKHFDQAIKTIKEWRFFTEYPDAFKYHIQAFL